MLELTLRPASSLCPTEGALARHAAHILCPHSYEGAEGEVESETETELLQL